ncbi:MAG: hypothetical protein WCG80_08705 [Spirochaetales bacterium]
MSASRLEKLAYGGWPNCVRLTDGRVELVVTLDVGPRVIRFGTVGGQNLFKEFAEHLGQTSGNEWLSFGGHRLWHAPEVAPRTYAPDFDPVEHRWDGATLTLLSKTEPTTGIRKEITLRLEDGRVHLNHRLVNENLWAIDVAPWALSVMAAGGRALVPQEPFVDHGVSFTPARPVVLWRFTRMNDPRFTWGDRLLQFRQDESLPTKQKFGLGNRQGWAAYELGRQLFVKTFAYREGQTYPDQGCNCEFFTMPGFLEVETLGPLARLEPGQGVDHQETWYLFDGVNLPAGRTPAEEPALVEALKPYLKEAL